MKIVSNVLERGYRNLIDKPNHQILEAISYRFTLYHLNPKIICNGVLRRFHYSRIVRVLLNSYYEIDLVVQV